MSTPGDPRRKNYAKRTAESQAAFFTRHLRPGMRLLDLGCGPGSITGTSPYVGKQLRSLLVEAGFERCESTARVDQHGTLEEIAGVGAFTAGLMSGQQERIVDRGLASADEVTAMAQAWKDWSAEPGGFLARFWVEAVGWAA